jgi:GT2 family glycosyltransferase
MKPTKVPSFKSSPTSPGRGAVAGSAGHRQANGSTGRAPVESAAWLADDVLAIACTFDFSTNANLEVKCGGRNASEASWMAFSDSSAHKGSGLILARFAAPIVERAGAELHISQTSPANSADQIELDADHFAAVVTDAQGLVRHSLASLQSDTRASAGAFLAHSLRSASPAARSGRLAKSLVTIREALRERLPQRVMSPEQSICFFVESVQAVSPQGFYVRGWLWDDEMKVTRLTAISPEGARAELLEHYCFRFPRPDINKFFGRTATDAPWLKPGFISYFELDTPSQVTNGWTFELHAVGVESMEAAGPVVSRDAVVVRDVILRDLAIERLPNQNLRTKVTLPALTRLQETQKASIEVESVEQYGQPPAAPTTTVIVPLYQRIDFVEHQMSQFVHDRQFQEVDLIYVLDSPELADALADSVIHTHRLYRVPFRTVVLKRNSGFSAVNNIGASLARGRLLQLMNSDVLPCKPQWLGKLEAFYDSTPRIGALGPKLLYEDDSLQHAGLYFYRPAGAHLWENLHYFKGLHRRLPAANVARPVPAVTCGCMMIARELFKELGGLAGSYVQGDYEDSDLCLRLIEAGRENWYCPDVELYHLEGQSYPSELRQATTHYNRWLHTHLWDKQIQAVMERFGS